MTLHRDYQRVCEQPSDIYQHLPTLHDLVLDRNMQQVIELGVRTGRSTVALLHALAKTGGRLWSCDIEDVRGRVPRSVRAAKAWTLHLGNSVNPATGGPPAEAPEHADLVFIDTSHHYQQTLDELNAYASRTPLFALHDVEVKHPDFVPDTDPDYPVRAAIDAFMEALGGWELRVDTGNNGLAILTRK